MKQLIYKVEIKTQLSFQRFADYKYFITTIQASAENGCQLWTILCRKVQIQNENISPKQETQLLSCTQVFEVSVQINGTRNPV